MHAHADRVDEDAQNLLLAIFCLATVRADRTDAILLRPREAEIAPPVCALSLAQLVTTKPPHGVGYVVVLAHQ